MVYPISPSRQTRPDWNWIDQPLQGGTIRGSINLPAQSLYPSIPTLYTLFKAAGVKKVLWYCGMHPFALQRFAEGSLKIPVVTGSSRGRGSRAAAWFADYISEHGDGGSGSDMQSLILEGGIKGWATGGSEFVEHMDGYDEAVWRGVGPEC